MKKYLGGLLGFILLLGIDQWSKWLVCTHLKEAEEIPVLGQVFVLHYLENRGAAFGILQNQRTFLIILTSTILLLLVAVYIKIPSKKRFVFLRMVTVVLAAGAVGNLCDRIFRRYVVDFLYFKWINFPVFNVADCYVVLSALAAILLIGFYYKEEDFSR